MTTTTTTRDQIINEAAQGIVDRFLGKDQDDRIAIAIAAINHAIARIYAEHDLCTACGCSLVVTSASRIDLQPVDAATLDAADDARVTLDDLEQALIRGAVRAADRDDPSGAARLANVYKRLSRIQGYKPPVKS